MIQADSAELAEGITQLIVDFSAYEHDADFDINGVTTELKEGLIIIKTLWGVYHISHDHASSHGSIYSAWEEINGKLHLVLITVSDVASIVSFSPCNLRRL